MAYIKVDHQNMLNAAKQVETYISRFDTNMSSIDATVVSLNAEWKGTDYQQIKTEWNEMKSAGSTSDRMRLSLKNYADAVREASKLYQEAQARAINRANTLCK